MAEKNRNFYFPKYSYKKTNLAYLPSKAYISLSQDGTSTCKPFVSVGDSVHEGQLIATCRKSGSSIHSPIPGVVQSFEEMPMPNGTKSECIVIKLGGTFTYTGKETKLRSWKYDTSSRLVSQIKQQGVINTLDTQVGPLSEQMESLKSNEKTLGVLLFDYDPSTTVCKSSLDLYQKEIFEGCVISARAMNADGIVFFYSSETTDFLKNSELNDILNEIPHCFIPINSNLYPSASPRKLRSLLQKNRQNIPEKISTNMKICIDTTTALQVFYGISYSLPVTHTLVEVNGPSLHEARIYSAKVGTPIKKLLEDCGGSEKVPSKIVINGLMKGTAINDLNIPVTKYLKSITLLTADSVPDQKRSLCIHCGLCRRSCPINLLPDVLYTHHVNSFTVQEDIRLSALLCDECALCNTTCPSRLPLFQTIAKIKEDIHESKI